jgi:hypothetical protein
MVGEWNCNQLRRATFAPRRSRARKVSMTRFFLALIALLALCGSARAQPTIWEPSFIPPQVDVRGNFMGGTEIRALVAFRGALYAANGYWRDQPGPEGSQTAQVLRLDSSHGAWQQEVNFGDFCPTTRPKCASITSILTTLFFATDKNGATANATILVAATWDDRPEANVYAKNNTDGRWYETTLATLTDNNGNGQARAFGVHVDAVTEEDLAFAGATPIGIQPGFLSDKRGAGKNPIEWATGIENAEFKLSDYTGPACTNNNNRVTAFAEAGGKIYASICFQVIKRVDGPRGHCRSDQVSLHGGCHQRWIPVWTDRDVNGSDSGLRGLTWIMQNGNPALLVAEEGGVGRIIRIDPVTGVSELELNYLNSLRNEWNLPTTYGIAAYNNMPYWVPATGLIRYLIGVESFVSATEPKPDLPFVIRENGGKLEGDAYYFIRNAADSYKLVHIPRLTTGTGMLAVQAEAVSPFADDCNPEGKGCAIFFGGFDPNNSPTMTLCVEAPCTFPPLVPFPTHNTGWIVKGSGFAGP